MLHLYDVQLPLYVVMSFFITQIRLPHINSLISNIHFALLDLKMYVTKKNKTKQKKGVDNETEKLKVNSNCF